MSGRIDPRQAKLDLKQPQRRPDSAPVSKAERQGSALQLSRPDTACGTPPVSSLDEQHASSLGFQPYRPLVISRAKPADHLASFTAGYPPAATIGDGQCLPITFEGTSDWESRDEMRQRELDEMRARVAQMEKTMRWWSDCTANWREKWSKVRGERNKARDECRQLRARLDDIMKECAALKREKQELSAAKAEQQCSGEGSRNVVPEQGTDGSGKDSRDGTKPCQACKVAGCACPSLRGTANAEVLQLEGTAAGDLLDQLQSEREENHIMAAQIERLVKELENLRSLSKSDDVPTRLNIKDADVLQPAPAPRGGEDDGLLFSKTVSAAAERQLTELRSQLEVLQADNANEWARRERTDSERYALERDNKKLKAQLESLREELDQRTAAVHGIKEGEVKAVQKELNERNKEIVELKHSHGKMKRLLQDRSMELEHSKRRAEQYEVEVRKLRTRVDELKRELAETQDELDSQGNSAKKLQRTIDELQETNESLSIQLEHMQSRLKSTAADALDYFKNRTVKSVTASGVIEEDSTDAFDSDEDFTA